MSGSFAPPAIGGGSANWAVPGTIGSTTPNTIVATDLTSLGKDVKTPGALQNLIATSTISASTGTARISTSTPITLTSNPQIAVGLNGQRLTIVNEGSLSITLVNGNGLLMPQNRVIYGGQNISFTYSNQFSSWIVDGAIPESLVLTGAPTAPTPGVGNNGTQLATTAFVEGNVAPVWSNFTFQNSFGDFGGGFQTCRFAKVRGIVYLQGTATRVLSGFTSGMVIHTLPVGNRPATRLRFPSGDTFSNAASVIDIDTSGNIILLTNGTPTVITPSFNHIVFTPA